MRIIGGKYGKRLIRPPANLPVRPTTDLAKESLFNILNNKVDFQGLRVLDLFAGTGSLSYEFASRGAAEVISVDLNFKCISFINKTIEEFGIEQMTTVKTDVFRFLQTTTKKFNMIFADPPYQLPNIPEISQTVFNNNVLLPGGWLIVEHPKEVVLKDQPHFVELRKYGHVNFSLFHIEEEA